MRALRLVLPLGWTALIAWLSTDTWSANETGTFFVPLLERLIPWASPDQIEGIHWLIRKTAHAVEYGVLASLWSVALQRRHAPRRWRAPLGLAILTAALDELHQATTVARTPSPADVLLDSAAAGAALIWLTGSIPSVVRWLTGALLWIAAAGGTALIALQWSVGVSPRWLWASTPAAWIALVFWRRWRRTTSHLPAWQQGDLPHPPASSFWNALRVIGPGTILLGFSLGAGDWLLGPALAVEHGPALLWICTLSVMLQALLNTEMARYTLATGESIYTGFMRTPPGPRFWARMYACLNLVQLGWPGWAAAGGSALAGLFLGRAPRGEDRDTVLILGYFLFLASVVVALPHAPASRRTERLEWLMLGSVLLFLVGVGAFLVPADVWERVAAGFVSPFFGEGTLPGDVDWRLLAAVAAYSGAGGVINAALTQGLREKGFGMAGTIGLTPTSIGRGRIPLPREGAIFPVTEPNLAKWQEWWYYLRSDLWFLWTPGCLIGMALPVVLAVAFVPPHTAMAGPGIGTVLAHAIGQHHGLFLGFLTLVTGLGILVSTQVGVTSGFARSVTDILWTSGSREGAAAGASRLYYSVLAVFTLAGCLTLPLADPFSLVLIGANLAAVNFVILAFHTLWVNRRLLPPELRPRLWREAAVAACGIFFAALVAQVMIRPAQIVTLFAR
ncbi:MAG TPA: Nramp family divalent metal transporter [Candidatus Methylomirabilis sp.]|nr:Nramp family divalent metal transporter [Candidatus Methylomirabilis sp.]